MGIKVGLIKNFVMVDKKAIYYYKATGAMDRGGA